MNYTYRIYPDLHQSAMMLEWLETLRKVYNRALHELKDWINSRKCRVERCSIDTILDFLRKRRNLFQVNR